MGRLGINGLVYAGIFVCIVDGGKPDSQIAGPSSLVSQEIQGLSEKQKSPDTIFVIVLNEFGGENIFKNKNSQT